VKTTHNTVLITGGTSGIGLALAKRFLREGNKVIITGTNAAKAEEIKLQMPTVTIELADMRDRQALEKLAFNYSEVNILINNAGIQYNYDFADPGIAPKQMEIELDINLVSPLYLTKLFCHSFLVSRLPQLLMFRLVWELCRNRAPLFTAPVKQRCTVLQNPCDGSLRAVLLRFSRLFHRLLIRQ
jgi:short-subunit dehydrogenase involved in D-alanine esterification of teichoic acids